MCSRASARVAAQIAGFVCACIVLGAAPALCAPVQAPSASQSPPAQAAAKAAPQTAPAAFLLKPHISLTDGLKVIAYEHAAGVIRVTVVEAKDPGAGSVTVVLGDQPMELRGWSLSDPQGSRTEVSFTGWKFGGSLDSGLFKFQDPNSGRRHR